MSNPYEVLGVSEQADDEQIKAAYRELARKYHPDNYQESPLADIAAQKMQEINAAYDQIMHQRLQGAAPGKGQPSHFADIRRLINNGRTSEAEELLDGIPEARRDGEWYFLKGSVCYSKGWLEEAVRHFTQATTLSPENAEYRAALNQLMWQRQAGYAPGNYRRNMMCSCCDVCTALYCANFCCRCCGGF